jgi:hypothetical protein
MIESMGLPRKATPDHNCDKGGQRGQNANNCRGCPRRRSRISGCRRRGLARLGNHHRGWR